MGFISEFFNFDSVLVNLTDIFTKVRTFDIHMSDVLDIFFVTFVIYELIKLIRDTRAFQLAKGLILLVIIYSVTSLLDMRATNFIFGRIFSDLLIVLIVIFNPEIRSVLEKMGRTNVKRLGLLSSFKNNGVNVETEKMAIYEISKACGRMSESKTGALIVFERNVPLNNITSSGIKLDSDVSHELVGNIFFPNSPLHDGAAIVRSGKIAAAGCVLPLTSSESLPSELGTRHRAAVGVSESSDAITVVVSEETGKISVTYGGNIKTGITESELREMLVRIVIDGKDSNF